MTFAAVGLNSSRASFEISTDDGADLVCLLFVVVAFILCFSRWRRMNHNIGELSDMFAWFKFLTV